MEREARLGSEAHGRQSVGGGAAVADVAADVAADEEEEEEEEDDEDDEEEELATLDNGCRVLRLLWVACNC